MAQHLDGFQLIQGLADQMVIVERQLSRIDELENKVKRMTCSHGSAIQRHYNEIKELRALVELLRTAAKNEPKELYTFAHIEEVLQHHQAYNNPQKAQFEVRINPQKYITIRLIDEQFVCKLYIGDSVLSVSLLMTEDANQVDLYIEAQK